MRREWIEIWMEKVKRSVLNLSPSMRREWIEIYILSQNLVKAKSPSMRREWIEMYLLISGSQVLPVSLHAEGVD